MRNQTEFNTLEMYSTACEFYTCACLCGSLIDKDEEPQEPLLVSEAVNIAFSCEIFLKTLLCLKKISFKKEHKLQELFQKLPDALKEEITNRFVKSYEQLSNDVWEEFILNVSDTFEKWRYCYESEHISLKIGGLHVFAEILKDMCSREMFCQAIWGK